MDRILDRFGHVQEEYEHLGGYALESQAREVLHGLGFKDDQIDGDVGALSGGSSGRTAPLKPKDGLNGAPVVA
jgi:ATPase subunit of ABC transporter with duplicated ATPase domains